MVWAQLPVSAVPIIAMKLHRRLRMNSIHFRKLSPCTLAPRLGNGFATVASKFAAVALPWGEALKNPLKGGWLRRIEDEHTLVPLRNLVSMPCGFCFTARCVNLASLCVERYVFEPAAHYKWQLLVWKCRSARRSRRISKPRIVSPRLVRTVCHKWLWKYLMQKTIGLVDRLLHSLPQNTPQKFNSSPLKIGLLPKGN